MTEDAITAQQITSFEVNYAFLSNFFPVPGGIWVIHTELSTRMNFPTVEHAYQACKTESMAERRKILDCHTPGRAKLLGAKVTLRLGWDGLRNGIMYNLLVQKFCHPVLKDMLLRTGNDLLIEGNTWGDIYWGSVLEHGQWVGENHLGRLLMQIREEAQA